MAKKITKESVKSWFKRNWEYVLAGGTLIGIGIGSAVAVGIANKSNGMIDPITIDRAKDDWMDQLDSFHVMKNTGRRLTVLEALECSCLDQYIKDNLKERGILTDNLEGDIVKNFCEEFPEKAAVLDKIEGFWHYIENEDAENQAS